MSKLLAKDCDKKAMEFILPNCHDKPYCFRSYKDLLCFFSNPISDKYSGPFAMQAWLALSICDKLDIEKKIKTLKRDYPYLVVCIEDIKNCNELDSNSEEFNEAVDGCKKFLLGSLIHFRN